MHGSRVRFSSCVIVRCVANCAFADPLEKAIEMGNVLDDETQQRVSKLHTMLRPYLLRRLKKDV